MYNKEKIFKVLREIKEESDAITPYVVIAQPRRSKDSPQAQILSGDLGLHIDFSGYSRGYVECFDMPVDAARNYLIECALETDADYLFFVGDDTVSPYTAFKELHKTCKEYNDEAVVVGVYYIKLSDAMIMVKGENNKIIVPNVDPGQVIEAWQTGMDCMLIPVKILKEMKKQDPDLPFCCIAHGIDDLPFIGEDNFFVYRLRKAGYKLLVNTNVQCLHMDVESGKFTAHPDVNLDDYFTNIPITGRLTMEDKRRIDMQRVTADSNVQHKHEEMRNEQRNPERNSSCF